MILQIVALVKAGKLKGKSFEVPYNGERYMCSNFRLYTDRDFAVTRHFYKGGEWWQYDDCVNGNIFVADYLEEIYKAVTSDVYIDKNLF